MVTRRSALVVAVEEVEPAVAELRVDLDPVTRLGVPAHVTVLFPFIPAREIDNDVVNRLADTFRDVPAFTHSFVRTEWFGDDVLWLASNAHATLRSLTDLVVSNFPDHPPYEGQFDEVVPHLTVADRAPVDAMRAAEHQLQQHLPIRATTRAITLLTEQSSGRWEAAEQFTLSDTRVIP